MFFRQTLCLITAGAMLGCGIHLGQKEAPPASITYNGAGYSCLGEIPQTVSQYFDDEMSEAEISEFVGCMQKSFISFAERTRGRDQDSYSPDEIRRFLESYFIKDAKISDEFLHQFMVLKQVVVGGDADRITRKELAVIIDLMNDIRTEALRLKPHLKYLNLALLKRQIDNPRLGTGFLEAQKALDMTIQVFADRFQSGNRAYAFADLEKFLIEFRKFSGWEGHFGKVRAVSVWINLMKAHKKIAVSPESPDNILPAEWQPWLEAMSQWYISFLQYQAGVKDRSVLRGSGLQNVMLLAHQVFTLAEQAVDRQPQKVIQFELLDELVSALSDMEWLPDGMKAKSLNTVIRAAIIRIFGDAGTKPNDRLQDGMDMLTVVNVRDEFYRWANLQKNLDDNFPAEGITILPDEFAPDLFFHHMDLPSPTASQTPMSDFMRVVQYFPQPLFADGNRHLFLVPKSAVTDYNLQQGFYNLSMMNALRAAAALIFRGYAESYSTRQFWDSGISSDELQKFYTDIRGLGIDMGFVDKKIFNAGTRGFIEAKLFTYGSQGLDYSGDGKQGKLSFAEAMAYFATLYSGAISSGETFRQFLDVCANGPLDDNGIAKVDRLCAMNEMPRILLKMSNMPYLQAYMRVIGPGKRQEYVQTLFKMVDHGDHWFSRGDMTTVTVLIYYAEAVMTRFDASEDGTLTTGELEAAFPVFKGFIRKMANEQMHDSLSDAGAEGVFFYIVVNKTVPSAWNLPRILWNEYVEPDLHVDRLELTKLFQAIIARVMLVGAPPEQEATKAGDISLGLSQAPAPISDSALNPEPVFQNPPPCAAFNVEIDPTCGYHLDGH